MEIDVTKDRERYIGGSDTPIIMGISPFKTRWELLMEKANPELRNFEETDIMRYGHVLEVPIRDFINEKYKTVFTPNQVIKGDLRGDSDGFNGKQILEVKTTSIIHEKLEDYKVYIVQMLFYMQLNNVKSGILAVYQRPQDLDETFDKKRLHIYEVKRSDFKEWEEEMNYQIERFREDLIKVKENPFLTEEDLQPKEVVEISNRVLELETQLAGYKSIVEQYETLKKDLKEAMQSAGIKKWTTNSGVQITLIPDGEDTTVLAFDEKRFKAENEELYREYQTPKEKKGKTGYVRITLPKG